MTGGHALFVSFSTAAPVTVQVVTPQYQLWVPKDATGDDDILLVSGMDKFAARIEEVMPTVSGLLRMRLNMLAERVVLEAIQELRRQAERQFNKRF
jgi:hypothetical protein